MKEEHRTTEPDPAPGGGDPPSETFADTEAFARQGTLSSNLLARGGQGTFGRYVDVRSIGSGGMGIVMRGTDPELDRPVAIKILQARAAANPAAADRFLMEAKILGQLEHPSIVPIHEIGRTSDGRPFFSMKLVRGESLEQVIERIREEQGARQAKDAWPRLFPVFLKVCDAVAFAHSKWVIHRDLKPANVMVGEFGEVLVMDWGLAKILRPGEYEESGEHSGTSAARLLRASLDARETVEGAILGTPAYMPPEQAMGLADRIDERSDVYSLGAILYEILTLSPPHEGKDARVVLARIQSGVLDPPSLRAPEAGIPAELEAVVLKAMARRRRDRYQSAIELHEEIEAYLDGRTISAARYSLVERAGKWVRRHRGVSAAGAAGLLAVLSLAAFLVPRWLSARAGERQKEFELLKERTRELEGARARERASVHLEAGRRILEQMRLRMRDPDYTREEMMGLARTAEAEFGKAFAEVPDHPEAWVGIGQAWRLAGDEDRALVAVERAIATSPGFVTAYADRVRLLVDDYERMRHSKGRIMARVAETPEAAALRVCLESDLDVVARLSAHAAERSYARGMIAFASGRDETAVELLGEYLAAAPSDAPVHFVRGHALRHLGREAEAAEEFSRAIRCDARHASSFAERGNARASLDDAEGALADYTQAIRLDSRRAFFHLWRGNLLLECQDIAGAIGEYEDAIRIEPRYAIAYHNRGVARERSGDRQGALEDYDEAIRLDASDPDYHFSRGALRGENGDHDGAIADYTEAIRLDPGHAKAFTNRAQLRRRKGDPGGALADLNEALRLDPTRVEAWNLRGLIYKDRGAIQNALAYYDRAISIDPAFVPAFHNRAIARRAAGDLDGALADADESVRLAPADPKGHYNRGLVLVDKKDLPGALAAYSDAIRVKPDFADAWYTRGIVRSAMGDLDGALADYDEAIRLRPRYPEALNNRGLVKSEKGDLDGAIADFEMALEVAPPGWPDRRGTEANLANARAKRGGR
ncbi:MAG: tetratricopeptide repeat protein [Planctomycetes bacterium]|nr:tetratricopeptide repeat protein [Planctomycetota bacterium]